MQGGNILDGLGKLHLGGIQRKFPVFQLLKRHSFSVEYTITVKHFVVNDALLKEITCEVTNREECCKRRHNARFCNSAEDHTDLLPNMQTYW